MYVCRHVHMPEAIDGIYSAEEDGVYSADL
jgi:hypothetical protein